jgi:hypothetical protein
MGKAQATHATAFLLTSLRAVRKCLKRKRERATMTYITTFSLTPLRCVRKRLKR